MFRKNTWPNVRVTEVEVAFHSFGYRAPHRCQLCLYCVPRAHHIRGRREVVDGICRLPIRNRHISVARRVITVHRLPTSWVSMLPPLGRAAATVDDYSSAEAAGGRQPNGEYATVTSALHTFERSPN